MPRLNVLPADEPSADVRSTLDQVGAQFGFVPNMFTMLASNPTVLDLVMTVQTKASRLLDARTRHTIALAVSEADGCDYCLALHTAGSLKGGMSVEDIELARAGSSVDPKRAAVARFAQRVIETRGRVSDADLAAIQGVHRSGDLGDRHAGRPGTADQLPQQRQPDRRRHPGPRPRMSAYQTRENSGPTGRTLALIDRTGKERHARF
ncbi:MULTISPECIES: carboxymuconolactone decarboxylase family protein [Micromonospora]|uniref:carboxymuconolactone decarboxylase family protein n=1 Tax=Micromonospora TaxID=1873 RepID=UPI00191C37A0|nr:MULTISPECIES: carboxymuconolactone decarboxylase family protein [unclassified Micromonospora]MBM0228234.1 carboxymuconolactone decarboxylase family protein [Micromonospora sp. ATA51]